MNYSEMDIDEDTPSPKRPVKKPRVSLTGPSADRINAQNIINSTPGTPNLVVSLEQDRQKKRFFRKDPLKVKPAHCKTASSVRNEEQKENLDDQQQPQTEPNDEDKSDEEKNDQKKTNADEDVKPKGVFNTTKHSLVKHKTVRYFKCPMCGIHKTTVLKLNDHFKRGHSPLKCDKCNFTFHTPSSLEVLKKTSWLYRV